MKRRTGLLTAIAFAAITAMSIAARSYRITAPVADWHSWRQADTAAVARNYLRTGIDLMHPRYDDLSNIQSGHDNPEGWRMVEVPLYQAAAVVLTDAVPALPIEVSLRILTILASAATGLMLGLIVRRRVGVIAGLATASLYAVLPYAVFYGRTILPDGIMTFWAVAALYTADRSVSGRGKATVWMAVSALSAAVAMLTKPVAAFILLPVAWIVLAEIRDMKTKLATAVWYAAAAGIPLLLWRLWIARYPEGIPVYGWLFNKDNIRFKGAFFRWLFAERIGSLILGWWGLVPVGLAVALKGKPGTGVFRILLLGTLGYLVVIAGGNVQHDYYQIMTLPAITVFGGIGLAALTGGTPFNRLLGTAVAGMSVVFAVMFSWYTVRTYYWINRPEIIEAGTAADRLIPKDAKVIAPYNGDTTFLYQIRRQGWPLGFDIAKKLAMGAGYYVTVSPTDADLETRDLARDYTVLVRNDKYAIIDLTRPRTATGAGESQSR